MTNEHSTVTWHLSLIQLLSVGGLLVSFYLYLFHEGSLTAVCGPNAWDDCGAVSGPDAPYASVGPVPVALLGLLGYAGIFLAIWGRHWLTVVDEYLPELLIGMTGLGFLFSLWLTGLEMFVIHAFCRYCIVSAVLITIMFVASILFLRQENNA